MAGGKGRRRTTGAGCCQLSCFQCCLAFVAGLGSVTALCYGALASSSQPLALGSRWPLGGSSWQGTVAGATLQVPAPVLARAPAVLTSLNAPAAPTPAASQVGADCEVPVFVHVPKNAGTAVVAGLKDVGIRGGQALFLKGSTGVGKGYSQIQYKCYDQHKPPSEHVPCSFVVVREPLDRLVSQYCYARDYEYFNIYHEKYGVPKKWPLTCEMVDKYAQAVLKLVKERGQAYEDCHYLPQWAYASKVVKAIPWSKQMQRDLRQLHPRLANLTLKVHNRAPDDSPCRRFGITAKCFSPSTVAALRAYYSDDYKHLGHMWQNP